MRYRFHEFELDTDRFSLVRGGAGIHVEPLVFDLLCFLVQNAGRVLTREAIITQVWKGRCVSDATVSSCVKSARKALGDSGQSQTYIRTVRGRGFQFTMPVEDVAPAMVRRAPATLQPPVSGPEVLYPPAVPPKIAVLPLHPLPADPELRLMGDALAQEVILELSRLHWLFVIARGSSFQFRGQEVDFIRAGEILGASYFLTGTITRQGSQLAIGVELCRWPESIVIWADRYIIPASDIIQLWPPVAGQIAAALEPRIQLAEASQAAKLPTEDLDAWAAYHRGLWHMYRFNVRDNGLAEHLFARALKLDPGFARAHAGLSFTNFQNAFLGFSPDQEEAIRKTREHAAACMDLDPLDPFVNLTMGRAEWLSGDLEAALPWLDRSIALSPNYAFGIYNSALIGTLLGDTGNSEVKVGKAIALSPIDPLHYAMLATRALTHSIRGDYRAAADWADRAVRSPNAHIQIFAIAAFTNELAGISHKAEQYVRRIRIANPHYGRPAFMKSFPFRDGSMRRQVEQSLRRLGL
jgi:TolB-like protein/DNA-binding winged helix-turn-helix (wHTH) protein